MGFNLGILSAGNMDAVKKGVTRLFGLYLEKTKLTVAERLSLLLAAVTMIFLCSLLAIIGMVFVSGALIELLALWISPIAAWAIIGGLYFLLAALIVLFRTRLIFNPVARFVSYLIFKNDPSVNVSSEQKASGAAENPGAAGSSENVE